MTSTPRRALDDQRGIRLLAESLHARYGDRILCEVCGIREALPIRAFSLNTGGNSRPPLQRRLFRCRTTRIQQIEKGRSCPSKTCTQYIHRATETLGIEVVEQVRIAVLRIRREQGLNSQGIEQPWRYPRPDGTNPDGTTLYEAEPVRTAVDAVLVALEDPESPPVAPARAEGPPPPTTPVRPLRLETPARRAPSQQRPPTTEPWQPFKRSRTLELPQPPPAEPRETTEVKETGEIEEAYEGALRVFRRLFEYYQAHEAAARVERPEKRPIEIPDSEQDSSSERPTRGRPRDTKRKRRGTESSSASHITVAGTERPSRDDRRGEAVAGPSTRRDTLKPFRRFAPSVESIDG